MTDPPYQPLFPELPVGLGDYTLTHLLSCHRGSESYIARQSHVERHVVLEVLHPADWADEAALTRFLATARARSAAHLPKVTAVLESTTSPEGYTYICQNLPEGTPLSTLAEGQQQLTPQQVCDLICAAAKLYEACASAGLATTPLTAGMVFMNREGDFNFLSPVCAGEPAENAALRQQQGLAELIRQVQPRGVPGQGRIATILNWMQDGYEGEPLDWTATASTAAIVAEQLRPDAILQVNRPEQYDRGREQRADNRRRRRLRRYAALVGLALLSVLVMGFAGYLAAPEAVTPVPALRGGYVHLKVNDKVLRVSPYPVSIAEYSDFLVDYASMEPQKRGSLSQNVPPTETDPTPTDWEAQLNTTEPDSPVTNVSYWQALMYARYQKAALPTATQLAAVRTETGNPGVEEWTQDEHPATVLYTKHRLVLPAKENASPLPENNPATRTPNRGFRICH